MTEPPYNSDIRSNTPSGLRGLHARLTELLTAFGELLNLTTLLTAIRDLVQRLMGANDPPGWAGLTRFFGVFDAGFPVQNVAQALQNVESFLGDIQISLNPTGPAAPYLATINTTATGTRADMNTRLSALLTEMQGTNARLDTLIARIGVPGNLDTGILPLLVSLDTNVGGIRECVCDGGTEPPPPVGGTNDPPTLCAVGDGWSAPARAASLVLLQTTSTQRIYGVQFFTSTPTPPFVAFVADVNPNWEWSGITPSTFASTQVCFSWNLTNNNFVGTMSIRVSDNATWGSADNSGNIAPLVLPVGNTVETLENDFCVGLEVYVDINQPQPPLNFFIQTRDFAPS